MLLTITTFKLFGEEEFKRFLPDGTYGTVDGFLQCMKALAEMGGGGGRGIVPIFNGMQGHDGWELLTELRQYLWENPSAGARFCAVKTDEMKFRYVSTVNRGAMFDLTRVFRVPSGVTPMPKFWFEQGDSRSAVSDRCSMFMLAVQAFEHKEHGRLVTVYIPVTESDASKVLEKISSSSLFTCGSMRIGVSRSGRSSLQESEYLALGDVAFEAEVFEGARYALAKVKSWSEDLCPLRDVSTNRKVFPDYVTAWLLAGTIHVVEGSPEFCVQFIGRSGDGKSTAIEYWTKNIMRGSVENSTTSGGGGMGVSHKEDGPETKFFKERNVLFVDEYSKFALLKKHEDGLAVTLKNAYVSKMEILQRKLISGSSKNKVVEGKMRCAYFEADNPDKTIIEATGTAYMLMEAPFRRQCFVKAERETMTDVDKSVDLADVIRKMDAWFMQFSGGGFMGMECVRHLMLYTRDKLNKIRVDVPVEWRREVRKRILEEAFASMDGYPQWFKEMLLPEDEAGLKVFLTRYSELRTETIRASYVVAAWIRAWEVYDVPEELMPVEDDRQKEIAEMLIRSMMQGGLYVLGPSVYNRIKNPVGSGIQRSRFGG